MARRESIVVFGATGNMGGQAANILLERGADVRAVTRTPQSAPARALVSRGAQIVQADLDDRASLDRAVAGARAVFSVQNWTKSGVQAEIEQGCRLADACKAAGVAHVVYGSAGTGEPATGVAHFDCKLEVERHMRSLGLGLTILRPAPFMELMTAPEFYPAVGVWGGERKIVGMERPIPWVASADIGRAIASAFAQPERWIGADVTLVGDVRSLGEARDLHVAALGRKPRSWPLPLWLIGRLAGQEFIDMWRWMVRWLDGHDPGDLEAMLRNTSELVGTTTSMPAWFELQARRATSRGGAERLSGAA